MKILITGASGLVGMPLVAFLTQQGHKVVRLVRACSQEGQDNTVYWDAKAQTLDLAKIADMDAVVHLAGENIASKRWTHQQKAAIRESRIQGTRFLAESLSQLQYPPQCFISASAIGYYGHRGDEILVEDSLPGHGFLSDVCQEWEAATQPAEQAGIRVVHARFGVILSTQGGALAKMLLPFQLGLGGILGNGQQYMSWIALEDVIFALAHILQNNSLSGPVNMVSPEPLPNKVFTQILGQVLHRPAILPAPAPALRLILGEMADALLLSSTRVMPAKLLESGFTFRYPDLKPALAHVLQERL